uniref:Poxvirus late transcription factor VLTF3-like protein n=1 Tax=viral metagenome TaxID=1070528 RepID=A0A6C0FCA4_9ZZZZ|tara:strand:+ start:14979 stop:16130 length:1152 start_codon:yes stop_codon:yes gene_type:complete
MPSFKPKTTKKIIVDKKSIVTLDGKHSEHIEQFTKDEETIETLLKEKDELVEKNKKHAPKSGTKLDNHMDRADRIKNVKKEVSRLKKKKLDYMLDNSKYVFGYFENKKKISEGESAPTNTQALNSFFKIDDNASDAIKTVEKNNTNIIQEYLSNVDRSFLDVGNFVYSTDVCQKCFKGELIPLEDEGVMICNKCHNSVKYLIENDKPSYKEPPKEVCFYAYKKINHFKEILSQFQGKETTQIPDKVIEELLLQIKKERIELTDLSYYKCKDLLKKLGYNKYYEHINFIKNKIGIKPVVISQELEETLCNFFMEIQYPYAKHCPDYRVNFLHYYYVLYKLFELLDQTDYLIHIPMLKDREKLIEQDTIWKNICNELDWEFIATV